jgi:Ca-activated chloride channel family protein
MNWIRFGHPHFLYLLWGTPVFILLYIYAFRQKRKAYQRFSSHQFFQRLTESVHFGRQKAKAILMTLSYTFLVLALSRPQIGTTLEIMKRSGLDIMIGLDISASMLAEDIKPNRLLKAKHAISSFIDQLEGDRVGLIAFAGDSFVQCPLTIDYAAAKLLLDALNVDTISQSGTEINQAIKIAASSFNQEEDKYKVLLFFTDGEDHGKRAIEAAKAAASQGIRIYCVGVGLPNQGTPIPLRQSNGELRGYKHDRNGKPIVTKLEDALLREIAQLTNGNYYQATPGEAEIDRLLAEFAAIEKRKIEERQFTQYEDRFQYFLAFALLFLVWEFLLPESRSNKSTADREEI